MYWDFYSMRASWNAGMAVILAKSSMSIIVSELLRLSGGQNQLRSGHLRFCGTCLKRSQEPQRKSRKGPRVGLASINDCRIYVHNFHNNKQKNWRMPSRKRPKPPATQKVLREIRRTKKVLGRDPASKISSWILNNYFLTQVPYYSQPTVTYSDSQS